MEDASPEPCTRQQRPYSATVLGGGSDRGADDERERADELARSESTVADSQAPEAQQEGEVRAECHAPVPDIPSVQHLREVALMRLKEHFQDNLKGYLIAQELHKGEASLFK